MTRREFTQRLKELWLVGIVAFDKKGWTIPSLVGPYHPPEPFRIIPTCRHHGSRVTQVTFSGSDMMIQRLREAAGWTPSRRTRHNRPITPNQLFEALGKMARGELAP